MNGDDRFQVRRVYDQPESADGARVLVDRLWPRGLSKEDAKLDEWLKDVTPSTELRRWYHHDAARYAEFTERYRAELDDPRARASLDHLRELATHGTVTLLTASKDLDSSHVPTLLDEVVSHQPPPRDPEAAPGSPSSP
ncbi:MAG TPA: DUF488 family protein [Stackebrandtia sp.]|jgi:uncharacterized protein YeaO (DUF488 family)|uniref:DUF488 domain-containing protein n=1 Tax=Stackebrandtia sp. TaxID=2023065 RepID=UPI002D4549DE|nr:DUF488 family protein [Stackebrandtia sp.]HZE41382.1 DUF488 family protein [Stackebrandtia sp.]